MNTKRTILVVIMILALAGLITATYDYIARQMGVPLWCPFAGTGCDTVQDSPYAVILGIPLSFLGIVGFAAYIVLAVIGWRSSAATRWPLFALLTLNIVAVCSMAYFAYLQFAVIHAVCSLCMFSALLQIALGIAILVAVSKSGRGAAVATT